MPLSKAGRNLTVFDILTAYVDKEEGTDLLGSLQEEIPINRGYRDLNIPHVIGSWYLWQTLFCIRYI